MNSPPTCTHARARNDQQRAAAPNPAGCATCPRRLGATFFAHMAAPDEGKLTDAVCFKVDERTLLDLTRHCARQDLKVSEFVRTIVRRELYGAMVTERADSDV